MKDIQSKKGIESKETQDKKEVNDGVKRGADQVDAGKHIDAADKKIKLDGTEEGAKDIIKGVSKAMDVTKKAHEGISKELDKKFGEIQNFEKDLSNRSSSINKDASEMKKEASSIKGRETDEAKRLMQDAIAAAQNDSKYLKDKENSEKQIRNSGEKENKGQASAVKGFKTRR